MFFSSCALHVINAAGYLLSGEDITTDKYDNIYDPKEFRLHFIRDLINSTTQGRKIVQQSAGQDEKLEYELKRFHGELNQKMQVVDSQILQVSILSIETCIFKINKI